MAWNRLCQWNNWSDLTLAYKMRSSWKCGNDKHWTCCRALWLRPQRETPEECARSVFAFFILQLSSLTGLSGPVHVMITALIKDRIGLGKSQDRLVSMENCQSVLSWYKLSESRHVDTLVKLLFFTNPQVHYFFRTPKGCFCTFLAIMSMNWSDLLCSDVCRQSICIYTKWLHSSEFLLQ